MSEKWSNMAPNLAQVGVMLGSKIVLDVSKGEKNASQRPLEKRIRKSIEKPRSGEAPRREVRGVVVVNERVCPPHYYLLSTLAPIQQDLKTLRLQASKLLKGLYCTEASKTST